MAQYRVHGNGDSRFVSLFIQVATLSYIWSGKSTLYFTSLMLENHGVICPLFSNIVKYASNSWVYSPHRKQKVPIGYTCVMSEEINFLAFSHCGGFCTN